MSDPIKKKRMAALDQALSSGNENLMNKAQLAEKLALTVRGIECLVEQKKIPVLRISRKCVRFSFPRVIAALQKFEVQSVG